METQERVTEWSSFKSEGFIKKILISSGHRKEAEVQAEGPTLQGRREHNGQNLVGRDSAC